MAAEQPKTEAWRMKEFRNIMRETISVCNGPVPCLSGHWSPSRGNLQSGLFPLPYFVWMIGDVRARCGGTHDDGRCLPLCKGSRFESGRSQNLR